MDITVHGVGNKLHTDVYRKPTHTGRYLNYNSNHPDEVKRSVVYSLLDRLHHCTGNTHYRQGDDQGIRTPCKWIHCRICSKDEEKTDPEDSKTKWRRTGKVYQHNSDDSIHPGSERSYPPDTSTSQYLYGHEPCVTEMVANERSQTL